MGVDQSSVPSSIAAATAAATTIAVAASRAPATVTATTTAELAALNATGTGSPRLAGHSQGLPTLSAEAQYSSRWRADRTPLAQKLHRS